MGTGVEQLGEFEVVPLMGQVAIGDRDAGDVPQWETGDEFVVSNSQLVVVACQSDVEGDVVGEVWCCGERPGWRDVVFDDEIVLTTPRLFIGSLIGNDGVAFDVGGGWQRLVVAASPPGAASRLRIAVVERRPD